MGKCMTEVKLDGVELACKSVISCEIFDKLTREGRLPMFIGVVQVCSIDKMDVAETVETLLNHFRGYLDKETFTEEMFTYIIKNNVKVAEAWGYGGVGKKVREVMIENRAFELAHGSESLEDIELYNSLYNKQETQDNSDNRHVINFNIQKR